MAIKQRNTGRDLSLTLPGYRRLESLAGMLRLLGTVVRAGTRPPFSWTGECASQCALILRRCFVPLMLSTTFFAVGFVVTALAGIVETIGTPDRLGGGITVGFIREPGYWVTSMIFAGVVGSAITADLAARRIRDELDALAVLGVETVRLLLVPRIVALMLMAPVLLLLSVLNGIGVTYLVAPHLVPSISGVDYLDTAAAFVTTGDIVSALLKCAVTGLFVGIVCCFKGLTAKGGSEGVGRAVNEAVLITFLGLWILNALWNSVFLAEFPDVQVLKG
jgi:phospholipid/cholesterol/gamma-HCH transport system permease protein